MTHSPSKTWSIKNSKIEYAHDAPAAPEERIIMTGWDWIAGIVILIVWLVLVLVVFPKLGIHT